MASVNVITEALRKVERLERELRAAELRLAELTKRDVDAFQRQQWGSAQVISGSQTALDAPQTPSSSPPGRLG
jgi:hypothetical protein